MKKIGTFFVLILFFALIVSVLAGFVAVVALALKVTFFTSIPFVNLWFCCCALYLAILFVFATFWIMGIGMFNQIININKNKITKETFKELQSILNKNKNKETSNDI